MLIDARIFMLIDALTDMLVDALTDMPRDTYRCIYRRVIAILIYAIDIKKLDKQFNVVYGTLR